MSDGLYVDHHLVVHFRTADPTQLRSRYLVYCQHHHPHLQDSLSVRMMYILVFH